MINFDTKRLYSIEDLDDILEEHKDIKFIKKRKSGEFANVPFAFDIESSSFTKNDEKQAIMYAWAFGIVNKVILGRTWEEFLLLLEKIINFYDLNLKRRIIIYIHNLEFEFQFFRKYFDWDKVFALDNRDVLFAITTSGIEFRCSYHLSGYKLETTLKHLHIYNIEKKVGDLNYKLIRHSKTPLTEKEKGYILNDVMGLLMYIAEEIEDNQNNITKIVYTQTGKVRKLCKSYCLPQGKNKGGNFWKYRKLISDLTISSVDEYLIMKESFQGGFTHANSWKVGRIYNNVTSFDFTSAYPFVCLCTVLPELLHIQVP